MERIDAILSDGRLYHRGEFEDALVETGGSAGRIIEIDRDGLGIAGGFEEQALYERTLYATANWVEERDGVATGTLVPGTITSTALGYDVDYVVYRPHGHFMNLFPCNGIVIVSAGDILCVIVAEDIFPTAIVGVVAHHFQPGVPLGPDRKLFGQFALKQVEWFAGQTHGGIGLRGITAGREQAVRAQNRQKFDATPFFVGKVLHDLAAAIDERHGLGAKIVKRQMGNTTAINRLTVSDLDKIRLHQNPPPMVASA